MLDITGAPRLASLATVGVGVVAATGTVHLFKRSFTARLEGFDQLLRWPIPAQPARLDLPEEVFSLADRLGAKEGSRYHYARLEQRGEMWMAPEAKPIVFRARQTLRTDAPGFLWRAELGRWGQLWVADYLVAGMGGLEVKLLGAVPLSSLVGGAEMQRGESLRYLAELPWNPDAILGNRELDWTVLAADRISVGLGLAEQRCEVTFQLDSDGLIAQASAAARPCTVGRKTVDRPWLGRFWGYHLSGGRLLPRWGEAAWVVDRTEFIYWRGKLMIWHSGGVERLKGLGVSQSSSGDGPFGPSPDGKSHSLRPKGQ